MIVNRLTHECCVDENEVAGDVGLLTSTAQRIQRAVEKKEDTTPKLAKRSLLEEVTAPMYELEPFDPVEGYKPKVKVQEGPKRTATTGCASGIPRLHLLLLGRGLSRLRLGIRVTQHGGEPFLLWGWFLVLVYALAALSLLMLTSLAASANTSLAQDRHPRWHRLVWIGLGSS